ncbi:MAG: PIN domain-containing protein [Candidatus Woesearchaeota archaeon]
MFSKRVNIFVPEFLFEELSKYKDIIHKRTQRPDVQEFFSRIMQVVKVVSHKEFSSSIKYSQQITPDPDDAAYLALAHHLRCPLWSEDKALRNQTSIQVLSTSQLLNLL